MFILVLHSFLWVSNIIMCIATHEHCTGIYICMCMYILCIFNIYIFIIIMRCYHIAPVLFNQMLRFRCW
jgi:hypothetical protein